MTRKTWKNSRAAKALRKQIIDNGYIQNGAPKPNEVYKSNRLYQGFKLDNFCSNYNRLLKNLKEEQEIILTLIFLVSNFVQIRTGSPLFIWRDDERDRGQRKRI